MESGPSSRSRAISHAVEKYLSRYDSLVPKRGFALGNLAAVRVVADFLGLTIETVSRTLTKFERDGMIEILPGGVRLLDLTRAKSIAAT